MSKMSKMSKMKDASTERSRALTNKSYDYFTYHPDAAPSRVYTCSLTGEKLYEFTSPCGARLYYMHKNVHLSAGVASVPYGGADDHVSTKMGRRVVSLAGCAHFAEHMLFTGKGGWMERFIALGAEANAYTSAESTAYCFTSGTEAGTVNGFSELMKMVIRPEFDPAQTEKEREIILRELGEDDDVFYEGRKRVIEMLFSRGCIRRDPGGSAKYVRQITNEMLQGIYDVAYKPGEFVFTLISNVGVNNARGVFETNLLGEKYAGSVIHSYRRNVPRNDRKCESFAHASGTVAFFCGIAADISALINNNPGRKHASAYVYTSMLNSMLLDRSEPLFNRLCEEVEGIYGEFVSDTEIRDNDCVITANLMCEDPAAVAEAFERIFAEMKNSGELFEFSSFESKRRVLSADYLTVLESPSEAAIAISEYAQRGECFFDMIEIIQSLDIEAFRDFARAALGNARIVYAASKPKQPKENKK